MTKLYILTIFTCLPGIALIIITESLISTNAFETLIYLLMTAILYFIIRLIGLTYILIKEQINLK